MMPPYLVQYGHLMVKKIDLFGEVGPTCPLFGLGCWADKAWLS